MSPTSVYSFFSRIYQTSLYAFLSAGLGACGTPDVTLLAQKENAPTVQSATVVPSTQSFRFSGSLPHNQLIVGLEPNEEVQLRLTQHQEKSDGVLRVGLLLPLSGAAAPVGQALLNAAQLALFDVATERLVLQIYDTQGNPDDATSAATLAISQGAQLLLGPVFSASVKAAALPARAAGINMIAFTNDPSAAAPGVFVIGFLVHEQVRQIIEYARTQSIERFAALIPNSVYGQTVLDAMAQIVEVSAGTLIRVEHYDPFGTDLSDVVRRLARYELRHQALLEQREELEARGDEVSLLALKRLERVDTLGDVDFDAVLVPERGGRLTELAALLPFYDVDPGRVQVLGTMLWDESDLGLEPALVGGLYPAPALAAHRKFKDRYRRYFSSSPPAVAGHGYDAVALTAALSLARPLDPFTSDAITVSSGFSGVDGIFRFLPTGLSERGFTILEVTRAGTEIVKPAATTFQAAQF